MRVLTAIITVFLYLPIWYYIMYYILSHVEASELVWFLFWVYVPVGLFSTITRSLLEDKK